MEDRIKKAFIYGMYTPAWMWKDLAFHYFFSGTGEDVTLHEIQTLPHITLKPSSKIV